jgi:hypothetical protein
VWTTHKYAGRWELIIDKARLVNKDDEACEDYYDELMTYVKQMCQEFPNPYVGLAKGKKPAQLASGHEGLEGNTHGDDERSEDGEDEEEHDEQEAEMEATPEEGEGDGEEEDETGNFVTSAIPSDRVTSLDNPYLLSPIIAHRLLDRITLWEDLRFASLPHHSSHHLANCLRLAAGRSVFVTRPHLLYYRRLYLARYQAEAAIASRPQAEDGGSDAR